MISVHILATVTSVHMFATRIVTAKGCPNTIYAQNVSLLLLNNTYLKNMGPTIHAAVMVHYTPIF
jgi:hypothetical protein